MMMVTNVKSETRRQLAFASRPVITIHSETGQETGNALLLLDPMPHQLRDFRRSTFALRDELHPSALARGGLEHERGGEVEEGGYADLTVGVESEFDAEDGGDGVAEFLGFGGEYL